MEYPTLSLRWYEHRAGPAAWRGLGNTLKWLYTLMDAVPLAIPGLSRSNLYFLFWGAVHPRLFGSIQFVQSRFYASAVGRELTKEAALASSPQKLAIWKRFTLLQSRLAEAVGKPALFFVQPNQYLSQSKPLSEEERRRAFNPAMAEVRDLAMRLVRDAVPELRGSGVPIFDMTNAFAGTKETLYQDDCCHFNARGNEILADAVLAILAQQTSDLWAPRRVTGLRHSSAPAARP